MVEITYATDFCKSLFLSDPVGDAFDELNANIVELYWGRHGID
jgi:hypothetical protein